MDDLVERIASHPKYNELLAGGADDRFTVGLESHARQSQGLGPVPPHLAGAVLDDHRNGAPGPVA